MTDYSQTLIDLGYIVASILFILGIKMLGRPERARKGNLVSALGMLIAIVAALVWQVILSRTRFGFSSYMVGSNIEATRYSGIDTRRVLVLIYTISGIMSALAGILMPTARFQKWPGSSFAAPLSVLPWRLLGPLPDQWAVR